MSGVCDYLDLLNLLAKLIVFRICWRIKSEEQFKPGDAGLVFGKLGQYIEHPDGPKEI